MRKWIGIICVVLGICCLLGAAGLALYNRWESDNAAETSRAMLEEVRDKIGVPDTKPDTAQKKMATVRVKGYDCIGVLSIPTLNVELPVLTDWSYAKLKKAPCLYYGTYYEKNFVIAAHNYNAHFGRLSELQEGDPVQFTDANGTVYTYKVALVETLPANATEEMIASGFDLSLYTCTTGGGSRVTVRCNLA